MSAATRVAREHGLRFERAEVLRSGSNLLVRLSPLPVVARMANVTAAFRKGDAWLAREVAVAGFLALAGAPVVAPSDLLPPGPHSRDGCVFTFLEYVEAVPGPLDAEEAGRRLRECHEALTRFPGELPVMALLDEADALLELLAGKGAVSSERAGELRRMGASVRGTLDALPSLPMQPVHGDADLANVINTRDGPLWNDWEDAMLAPLAWDLGCLHAQDRVFGEDPAPVAAAQAGYGDPPDPAVLDAFVEARAYQAAVWTHLFT